MAIQNFAHLSLMLNNGRESIEIGLECLGITLNPFQKSLDPLSMKKGFVLMTLIRHRRIVCPPTTVQVIKS